MQIKMQKPKLKSWLYGLAIFSVFLAVPMVTYADWLTDTLGSILYYLLVAPFVVLIKLELIILPMVAQWDRFTNMSGVNEGWVALRDMSNMFFIVILLIMSFATILKIDAYGYKQVLKRLILMAILINFSKLIVGLVIDASQLVMLTFVATWKDIAAGNIVTALGLDTIMNMDPAQIKKDTGVNLFVNIILGYLFAGVFMILTCIVVFGFIITLLARIVALWVLIVLSPLAFLANAFPGTQSYFGQWMSSFTKELIVGPVLAFFLWLSFTIVGGGAGGDSVETVINDIPDSQQTPDEKRTSGGFTEATETDNFFKFIVGIAMLLGALKVTQSIGGTASGIGMKMANTAKAGAIGAAAWGAAKVWRGTTGEGGLRAGVQNVGMGVAQVGLTGVAATGLFRGAALTGKNMMTSAKVGRLQRKEAKVAKWSENASSEAKREAYSNSMGRSNKRNLDKMKLESGEFKDDDRKETQARYNRAKQVNDTATMTKLENTFGFLNTENGIQASLKAGKGQETYSKMDISHLSQKDDNGVVTVAKKESDDYRRGQMLARGFLELTDKEQAEVKKTMDADSWAAIAAYVATLELKDLKAVDEKNKTKAYTVKRTETGENKFEDLRVDNANSAVWRHSNFLSKYASGLKVTDTTRANAKIESQRQAEEDVRVRDDARAKKAKPIEQMSKEEREAEAKKPEITDVREDDGHIKFDSTSADQNLARMMDGADLAKIKTDSGVFKAIAKHLTMAQIKAMADQAGTGHLRAVVEEKAKAAKDKMGKAVSEQNVDKRQDKIADVLAEIQRLMTNQLTRGHVPNVELDVIFNQAKAAGYDPEIYGVGRKKKESTGGAPDNSPKILDQFGNPIRK
ncbi:hypothetical protein KBC40_00805 [Patescibacteria group bacterium]|nr:hypothetical protein [Patescibacteria group bacterium]